MLSLVRNIGTPVIVGDPLRRTLLFMNGYEGWIGYMDYSLYQYLLATSTLCLAYVTRTSHDPCYVILCVTHVAEWMQSKA